jgi:hypothetical protein
LAEQGFYTSVEHGLEDHSGFQFVAVSPGLSKRVRDLIEPHLSYERPPRAEAFPTSEQLAMLPVAFGYAKAGRAACLVRCRYAGPDFIGRAGNFLGMAVFAQIDEVDYCRPIELWDATWWAGDLPLGTDSPTWDLPGLESLDPGPTITPEAIVRVVARRNRAVLAGLIDAVHAILDGADGPVVVVAEQTHTVALWIAAATYSLPFETAQDVSFLTYSRHPLRAPYHLVGTTPAAWSELPQRASAFLVDEVDWRPRQPPSGYGLAIADLWQQADLADLDELVAVASEVVARIAVAEPRRAAHDRNLTAAVFRLAAGLPGEVAPGALADFVRRAGRALPSALWSRLAESSSLTTDIALALAEAVAADGRAPIAGRLLARAVGGALEDPAERTRLRPVRLTDEVLSSLNTVVAAGIGASPSLEELGARIGVAEQYRVGVDLISVRELAATLTRSWPVDVEAAARATGLHKDALLDGVIDGLEAMTPETRAAVLTPAVCDLLESRFDPARPQVAHMVAVDVGRRRPDLRLICTRRLADLRHQGHLDGVSLAADLAAVWPRPSAQQVHLLIDDVAGRLAPVEIAGLAVRAWCGGALAGERAQALADRILALGQELMLEPVLNDATLVRWVPEVGRSAASVTDAARALLLLEGHATPAIHDQVTRHWLDIFDRMKPARREKPGPDARELLDRILSRHSASPELSEGVTPKANRLVKRYWTEPDPSRRPR